MSSNYNSTEIHNNAAMTKKVAMYCMAIQHHQSRSLGVIRVTQHRGDVCKEVMLVCAVVCYQGKLNIPNCIILLRLVELILCELLVKNRLPCVDDLRESYMVWLIFLWTIVF